MTLFELSVAGALLAVSAVGLSLLTGSHSPARSRETAEALRVGERLSAAVAAWRVDDGDGCPTVSQLIHEGYLDPATPTGDPWGNRFQVACESDAMAVTSPGPDRLPGTRDDLRFVIVVED